jgi:hypothetical protein
MPDIPPLITSMPNSQPLYAPYTPLPSGLATNLTWSANTPGTNYSSAAITVSGITSNAVISAAVQSGTYSDTNNCWLMSAAPSLNTITFNLYGQPATAGSFIVAWAVAKF